MKKLFAKVVNVLDRTWDKGVTVYESLCPIAVPVLLLVIGIMTISNNQKVETLWDFATAQEVGVIKQVDERYIERRGEHRDTYCDTFDGVQYLVKSDGKGNLRSIESYWHQDCDPHSASH